MSSCVHVALTWAKASLHVSVSNILDMHTLDMDCGTLLVIRKYMYIVIRCQLFGAKRTSSFQGLCHKDIM